jgi:protein-S-isoprenylcysteine O-methyltransferase Ste14
MGLATTDSLLASVTLMTGENTLITSWGWAATVLLVLSFTLDSFLGKRYAGGSSDSDGASCKILLGSMGFNLSLLYVASAFGVGVWQGTELTSGIAGLTCIVIGLALRYGAIFTLGERFTWRVSILESHQLIRRGIYRYLRHPSYTGGLLAFIGVALAFRSWLSLLLFTLTYLPAILHRIRVEEQVLAGYFAEEFQDYRKQTRRLIPFVY